jgi:hypothetical protein
VSSSLALVASWDLRFGKIGKWPLKLLLLVERPASEVDERRRQLAKELLDTPICCLRSSCLFSDAPEKVRDSFGAQLREVVATGKCPADLHSFLLLVRSHLALDTQEIEGANSVLQAMAKAAPQLRTGLASDRMKIKKGDPMKPDDALAFHPAVKLRMRSDGHINRFAALSLVEVPAEEKIAACPHTAMASRLAAHQYALALGRNFGTDVRAVWAPNGLEDGCAAFVACWSY